MPWRAERSHGDVLVLAVYPGMNASTRLRGQQYAPFLAENGRRLQLWSFVREKDAKLWFDGGRVRRVLFILLGLFRTAQMANLARRADCVIVIREVLPFGPPFCERLLVRRRPLIWDVDDAIWRPYPRMFFPRAPSWLRPTTEKYRSVCRLATEVWAASEPLAEWCRDHNPNVKVVPTVVDVPGHRPQLERGRTAVWIGSHSTVPFVERILPELASLEPPVQVHLVGASRARSPRGLILTCSAWSPSEEEGALAWGRVGLYPLDPGHALAEGRGGLKAVLYMSAGIPPVVTPTVTNVHIVRDRVEGLHARGAGDWAAAVGELLDDEGLWERCSTAAYERARQDFSVQAWGPRVAGYVEALILLAAARGANPPAMPPSP